VKDSQTTDQRWFDSLEYGPLAIPESVASGFYAQLFTAFNEARTIKYWEHQNAVLEMARTVLVGSDLIEMLWYILDTTGLTKKALDDWLKTHGGIQRAWTRRELGNMGVASKLLRVVPGIWEVAFSKDFTTRNGFIRTHTVVAERALKQGIRWYGNWTYGAGRHVRIRCATYPEGFATAEEVSTWKGKTYPARTLIQTTRRDVQTLYTEVGFCDENIVRVPRGTNISAYEEQER